MIKFLDRDLLEQICHPLAVAYFDQELDKIPAFDKHAISLLESALANPKRTLYGEDCYPKIEDKAHILFYTMIKNHPFIDGNKRSGAFSFIWFLKKAGILNTSKLTSPALTAITLFTAESDPKNKEKIIRLVLQLLKK